MGFIYRNTKDLRNHMCLKNLYCSLVTSNLEFGSLIWSNNYSTYINDLNNIQYTFLKIIAYVSHCSISRDSFHLVQGSIDLKSLSIRRNLMDIIFVYDISNNYINCPEILNVIGFRIPIRNTCNSDLFYIPKFKTNCGNNFFFSRALLNSNKIFAVLDFLFYLAIILKHKA